MEEPEWLAKYKPLLGIMSDRKIAHDAGVPQPIVNRWRRKLGIPKCKVIKSKKRIPKEKIHALGTDTDQNVAKVLGVSASQVAKTRRALGVESRKVAKLHEKAVPVVPSTVEEARLILQQLPEPPPQVWVKPKWVLDNEHLFGNIPDEELGSRIGLSRAMIALVRKRLGIQSYAHRHPIPEWVEKHKHLFGKMSDIAVAGIAKVSAHAVSYWRNKLNIAAYVDDSVPEWVAKYGPLLGTMPDTRIAEMAGISHVVVCLRRQKLNIPKYMGSK